MRNLSEFIHSFDFIHAHPDLDWLEVENKHTIACGLSVPGSQYSAYIADAREIDEPNCGTELTAPVEVILPEGDYGLSIYSPVTGLESPSISISGGAQAAFQLPPFTHDIVLIARRRK